MKIANKIAMFLTGAFLIVAAIMKVHQMLTQYVSDEPLWESWHFFLAAIPLEFGLGVWLVSGLFKKAGWLLGTLTFAFFIVITAHKAVTGQTSCGCFGTVEVNPWVTLLAIDIPIFLLLVIFRPKDEKLLPPPWPHGFHCLAVAIPACLIMGAMVPTMYFNKVEKIDPKDWATSKLPVTNIFKDPNEVAPKIDPKVNPNQPVEVNDINITTPDNDANEVIVDTNIVEKPILPDINDSNLPEWAQMALHTDIAEKLFTGTNIVFFYHYNCDDCEVAIPLYSELSEQSDDSIRFALVSGPPHAPEGEDVVPEDTTALVGRLDDSRPWIFESPLILLMSEGELIKWWQGEDYPKTFEEIIAAFE